MSDHTEREDTCTVCGKPKVRNRNVENKGVDLCDECLVEYQTKWRPEHSPVELDVLRFVRWKNGCPG